MKLPLLTMILMIAMTFFMAGYIYRDNTILRTLKVEIQWPAVNEADIDRMASK